MTTIAYRDGVIAADTGTRHGGWMNGKTTKIARNDRGDLAGGSGRAVLVRTWLEWFRGGEKGPEPVFADDGDGDPLVGIMVIRATGEVMHRGSGPEWTQIEAEYDAIGSGMAVALGAMYAGADAERAVRAAIAHEESTDGEVMVLTAKGD